MTRRSLLATLAALLGLVPEDVYTSLRSLVRGRRPCYRGSIRSGEAVVLRPDGSRLDPLPLVLVESLPLVWTTKYTPRPYPVSGFAWGPIRASHGRTQLAAAVLLDYTGGNRGLAGGVLLGKFGAVFSAFPLDTSWRLPLRDIDRFLADSIPQDRPHLDPTPGAHRRPDLVEASAWRFRPDPEDMAAARLRRVMAIERSAWLNG